MQVGINISMVKSQLPRPSWHPLSPGESCLRHLASRHPGAVFRCGRVRDPRVGHQVTAAAVDLCWTGLLGGFPVVFSNVIAFEYDHHRAFHCCCSSCRGQSHRARRRLLRCFCSLIDVSPQNVHPLLPLLLPDTVMIVFITINLGKCRTGSVRRRSWLGMAGVAIIVFAGVAAYGLNSAFSKSWCTSSR